MDVPVEDRHALDPVRASRVFGRDGDVVEEAEAHRALGFCVVTRRPHRAERRRDLPRQHAVDRETRASGREPRDAIALGDDSRVRVEHGRSTRADVFEREHVVAVVDGRELID